jgi:hypothetical protein
MCRVEADTGGRKDIPTCRKLEEIKALPKGLSTA